MTSTLSRKPANLCSYSKSEIITILVGKDGEHSYTVHKDLLLKSKFFAACLKNECEEANSKIIKLPEDSHKAVEHFIEWLYTGRGNYSAKQIGFIYLVGFADKICSDEYYNATIDSIRSTHNDGRIFIGPTGLKLIYDSGLRDSPFATYALKSAVYVAMTDSSAFQGQNTGYDDQLGWWSCPELMRACFQEILVWQKEKYASPRKLKGCHFHRHEDGEQCSKE